MNGCSLGLLFIVRNQSRDTKPARFFPRTGKTLMLVLQGLKWARQGRDVDVVSPFPGSLASNVMIQHQLQMTLRTDPSASPAPGTVRLHTYDFRQESDMDRCVRDLTAGQRDTLCVLMDEANDSEK